jgi:hypothetical protein
VTLTPDYTLDIKAAIDDYSSLTVNVDGGENLWLGGINKILVATDVGMWLGLPVGLTVSWGYDDPDMNEFYNISGYSNEDWWFDFASPSGEYWGLDLLMSASFVEVEAAINPLGGDGDLLVGLAVKEPIPGLNAEVYYYQNEVAGDFAKGRIGLDAAYAGEFSGFGVEAGAFFGYDLDDTAANAYVLGVGLEGAYSIATITVGLDGTESDILNSISATGVIAAIDMLDIYAGLWYDMAGSELVEIDLGVNAHIGAVEMFVGYLVDGDSTLDAAGDNFKAPPGVGESAAYIKFDVDY